MSLFKKSTLLLSLFLIFSTFSFSQTNFLQNSSFENWSGSPESPDNWTLANENSILKSTDANDGNFSLEIDLNNSLQFKTELFNTSTVQLATNTTYTYSFDYKVKRGINISAEVEITKDGNSFGIPIAEEFVPFNDDGNWHTFSFDFDTNNVDEEHIFKLVFRANIDPTGLIGIDNIRVLGNSLPDSDNDGVLDNNDQCPNTSPSALAVDDNGCEVTIDQSNILTDPSFEDWSLGGGDNLRDWGILIQAGGWNKNTDINDNLLYSVELTTSDSGSYFASIFQNDLQLYKDVPYNISIDYKVVEGTFNELELEFTEGAFADTVEKFTLTNFQTGWNTFTATYTPTENILVDLSIDVSSNGPEGRILLDNSTINATIGGLGPDADNDGVNDSKDNCPNTPSGETVNENGCSQSQLETETDSDNDGVTDENDNCPNTPTGETVDVAGCSQSQLDDDNDGVFNDNDDCANTPAGEAVDANGCSQSQLDDDDDGVTNDNDNCPNTPSGETVNAEGCAANQNGSPDIPADGIKVKVTSTSCPDNENGEITVSFDQDYSYTVHITAELLDNTFDNLNSVNGLVRSNLPADTYSVCVTIPDFPSFEQCFTVVIETTEDFESGKTVVDRIKKQGTLVVSGSKTYEVLVNNRKLNYSFNDTGRHELSFELRDGANTIVAKTDKNCQGEYSEMVMMNSIRVFPNPSAETITVLGLKNDRNAVVSLLDMSGLLVKTYSDYIINESLEINITDFPEGIYFVQIKSTEQNVQAKVLKQ